MTKQATAKETGYNGFTNYETWAVALWIGNEQSSQEYWHEQARAVAERCADKRPNAFMGAAGNRRSMLASMLKDEHENGAEEFMGNQSSVFADLMNAALGSVDWYEVAQSLLDDLPMSEFSLMWHKDGHYERLIAGNLSAFEAQHRLEQLAAEYGQPILPGYIVNESGEDGCGYYFLRTDEDEDA